jgi:hypothetical protein
MKTLILTLVLALSFTTFSQEELNDDLIISTEKLMRKGEWCHLEIYGYNSYDCNRRFFYKCNDKVEMDSVIISLLDQYGIDTKAEGKITESDKGDICRTWKTTENGWDVMIHTYINEYGKYMIYIRFD